MLDEGVRTELEGCIKEMIKDMSHVDENGTTVIDERVMADAIRLMEQLDSFTKTDLEEEKDRRRYDIEMEKFQVERERIETEAETKNFEVLENKPSKKEKRAEKAKEIAKLAIELIGIGAPLAVTAYFMNKGFKFEERDLMMTSKTATTAWQAVANGLRKH